MSKLYRIAFATKKNGYQNWFIDVEANSQQAAIQIAKDRWFSTAHMFGIRARQLADHEEFLYHTFVKTDVNYINQLW